jgi:DNA-binding beta-propeller fold protein YncE
VYIRVVEPGVEVSRAGTGRPFRAPTVDGLATAPLPGSGPGHVQVVATPAVAAAVGSIGRTEDVAVSPDGTTMALAAFDTDAIAFIRFERRTIDRRPSIVVTSCTTVRVEGLRRPHGVAYLSDRTLVVANRESELLLVELGDDDGSPTASGRVLVDGGHAVPVRWPGSVAASPLGDDLVEILVCNNYAHDVTRYVVDGRSGWTVVDAEVLLAADLDIPDGVAVAPTGRWIAVSNHNRHCVNVYRYDEALGPDTTPTGTLRRVNYPHGLRFSADGSRLFVADAGLPFVHRYDALDGDWSGEREPAVTWRVMDDETFDRGRHNPQEGGPKGLVTVDDLVVVTSEHQPLAVLAAIPTDPTADRLLDTSTPPVLAATRAVRRAARRLADREAVLAERSADRAALDDARDRIATLGASLAAAEEVAARAVADAAVMAGQRRAVSEELAAVEATVTWRARTRLLPVLRPLADLRRRLRR